MLGRLFFVIHNLMIFGFNKFMCNIFHNGIKTKIQITIFCLIKSASLYESGLSNPISRSIACLIKEGILSQVFVVFVPDMQLFC